MHNMHYRSLKRPYNTTPSTLVNEHAEQYIGNPDYSIVDNASLLSRRQQFHKMRYVSAIERYPSDIHAECGTNMMNTSHKASNVRAYLANDFGQHIISYRGPIEKQPHSPD